MSSIALQHAVVTLDAPSVFAHDREDIGSMPVGTAAEGLGERFPSPRHVASVLRRSVRQRQRVIPAQVGAARGGAPGVPAAAARRSSARARRSLLARSGTRPQVRATLAAVAGNASEYAEFDRDADRLRPPEPHEISRERREIAAEGRAKLDEASSALIDHLERSVEALDPGLTIVERLDRGEPPRVLRPSRGVDVGPPLLVARPRKGLVEHVEIEEPPIVDLCPVAVDVRGAPVISLDHANAITKVPGVAPPRLIGRSAGGRDVQIGTVALAHRAATALEVPPQA